MAEYLRPSIRDALFANVLAVAGADVQLLVSALGNDAIAFGGVPLAMRRLSSLTIERLIRKLLFFCDWKQIQPVAENAYGLSAVTFTIGPY